MMLRLHRIIWEMLRAVWAFTTSGSEEQLINGNLFYLEPERTAFSLDVKPVKYPEKCKLVQLHLNMRHGARYPAPNDINAYEKLEKAFANVPIAKEWYKNVFPMRKNFQLIKRGEIESFFDGKQSRQRYPEFWRVKYDPEVVKFQSAGTSRAGASAMAFSEGLFNGKGSLDTCKSQPVYISSVPVQDEILTPFFDTCSRWNETVFKNNPLRDEQLYSYGNKTLAQIAKRLSDEHGLSPPLDPHLLPYMFTNCQYWVVHFNRTDTWCSLLSRKELLLLRYYWDIWGYYTVQYGHPLNKRIACRYITQLVNGVDDYISGKSLMIADLKFAHGYILLTTFTLLGVFKENHPLTADLTFEQIKKVRYTEYATLHWTSTLYWEVYSCSGDHKDNVKIRAVLNFKPLVIPGCGSEYCDWNKFKELFSDQIGCDFKKMCTYP
ncbi:8242_t:CDS:2 [Entrophospora sp. SA101]|nr:8242_t:CDS:2 [Entrophospora sp. SA101]